ncbi:MAG: TadE/TadG family type IV pilus assembly protein [Anaerolineae bacterium]|nr:pilus assembly protein [Anaerolineae bacterium]MDW8100355.1 TadE/TadG family type IV pilus assembly protein [Anaerolineae bacterium]
MGGRSSAQAEHAGQNLVELALLLPLLVAVLGLILDMGRGVQAYIVAHHAAREAVRYAAIRPTDVNGIRTAATNELQRGGLQPANATVSASGSGIGNPVRVTVSYRLPLVFGLLGSSQLTIRATAEAVIF